MTDQRDKDATQPPAEESEPPAEREMIPLQDLAPRQDVKGGTVRLLFGQDATLLFDENS